MPSPRSPHTAIRQTPAERRAQADLERRFLEVIDWKEAINREAWRAARAEGRNHCSQDHFDQAEAAVIASGHACPAQPWPDASLWPRHWHNEPLWPHEQGARAQNLTSGDLGTRPRRV